MFNPVPVGKRTRYSYAKIKEVMDMPHLLDIQCNSYKWFLKEGLKEIFEDVSPIEDHAGNLKLEFLDFSLGEPKYDLDTCKAQDVTYAAPLRVGVRLSKKVGEPIMEGEVFMGDFPLQTKTGTFVINGAERVIVSQLVRSPGAYYTAIEEPLSRKKLYSVQVIPNRGAWIELETDKDNIVYVRIDRGRKFPVTTLLRALDNTGKNKGKDVDMSVCASGSDAELLAIFADDKRILETLKKDTNKDGTNISTRDEALKEIYKKQRPGDPVTEEGAESMLRQLFFDPKRYDLAKVGRYKLTKKLGWKRRILKKVLAEPLVDRNTGEVLVPADVVIEENMLQNITPEQEDDIWGEGMPATVKVRTGKEEMPTISMICSRTLKESWRKRLINLVLAAPLVDSESGEILIPADVVVDEKMIQSISLSQENRIFGEGNPAVVSIRNEDGTVEERVFARVSERGRNILRNDIFASVSYLLNLMDGIGHEDDIDHLGNRRVRSVGELLQNQFRIGLTRMERVVRERMNTQDAATLSPQTLINIRPVVAAIKEFFGSSQLSQFMDQNNPLSELTHKRRLSALGPGGLSRERAGFEVRDVHNSHYGRMCPIETPEGPNIGLIGSLSNYARVNEFGFMETPYLRVDKQTRKVTDEFRYLTADSEDDIVIAQANEPLDENGWFKNERVTARKNGDTIMVPCEEVDYMDVSPKQVVSIATAMIPFLENDDANRALMGANMQRQAVPLLRTQAPLVGTGMEYKAACDSGVMVLAERAGVIQYVSADRIEIVADEDGRVDSYKLLKFQRSNQGTCINQVPIVYKGDKVFAGQPIADGPATDHGELALGYNIIVAYMPWEGYNYEDAVLLNENLVKRDLYTSIHIEEYDCSARDTKLGAEEITRDIPNVSEDALRDLDEDGIIRVGAEVRPGDILVGKVTPKGETEPSAEERLLRAIFNDKAREVRDTSLRVPHGEAGRIVAVKLFDRENNAEMPAGVNRMVRIYIAQKRKISVGDKMSGRHGNKGVVSRIMRQEDMPFLPDGTPVDIVLNPLGVPSRMNIGQILETHLGMAVRKLGDRIKAGDPTVEQDLRKAGYDFDKNGMPIPDVAGIHIATPVFDGAKDKDVFGTIEAAGLPVSGKTVLYDGRTGEPFENPVTVGCVYMLKLHHLVDDKIHARSTGPYSLVTQQPLGGKAQFGGQRFGEMEVWALEAYGAAYTLQEILTVKSDDVVGRVKTYESIVKGENIPAPGVPESFKVLIKELQSIGLDISVLDETAKEIKIQDDEEDLAKIVSDDEAMTPGQTVAEEMNESIDEDPDKDYNGSADLDDDDIISDFSANSFDDIDE